MDQIRMTGVWTLLRDCYGPYMEAMVDWETETGRPNLRAIPELQPLMKSIAAYVTEGDDAELRCANDHFLLSIKYYRLDLLKEKLVYFGKNIDKANGRTNHWAEGDSELVRCCEDLLVELASIAENASAVTMDMSTIHRVYCEANERLAEPIRSLRSLCIDLEARELRGR